MRSRARPSYKATGGTARGCRNEGLARAEGPARAPKTRRIDPSAVRLLERRAGGRATTHAASQRHIGAPPGSAGGLAPRGYKRRNDPGTSATEVKEAPGRRRMGDFWARAGNYKDRNIPGATSPSAPVVADAPVAYTKRPPDAGRRKAPLAMYVCRRSPSAQSGGESFARAPLFVAAKFVAGRPLIVEKSYPVLPTAPIIIVC